MALDNYDPSASLAAYFPSRDERRLARLWAREKVLHDLKDFGAVDFFEGPGSDPTLLDGYSADKLWLRVEPGVTDQPGEIRYYQGGDPTALESWPLLNREGFAAHLGTRAGTEFDFTWLDATSGDPGPGRVRGNHVTLSSVTELGLSKTGRQDQDYTIRIASWRSGDVVRISGVGDELAFLDVILDATPVDQGDYYTVACTVRESAPLSAGQIVGVAQYPLSLADEWAEKTDGPVDGADGFSSKAWAVGGTGVTDTAGRGSAKDWATKAEDQAVDGSGYSAYHWAQKAEDAQEAAADAQEAAETAQQLAEAAQQAAEAAQQGAETAEANAEAAQIAAESARDAAFVNAEVFDDTTDGLAGTTEGDQFQVVEGDEIVRYIHESGPTATEVARYPAASAVRERLPMPALAGDYVKSLPGTATWHDRRKALDLISAVDAIKSGLIVGLTSDGGVGLDSGAVDVAYDFSGNGNDAAALASGNRPAVGAGGQWVFDGDDDYLRFGAGVLRDTTCTLDVVFQIDDTPQTNNTIISLGTGSETIQGWRLVYNATAGGMRFEYRTSAGLVATGWVRIRLGVPLRATVTFEDQVGASLYLNGALVASVTSDDALLAATPSDRRAIIGGDESLSTFLEGQVWRVLAWDRILSTEEISSLDAILASSQAAPPALQPHDFYLNGVLDNSAMPDWIPAAVRPTLQHEGTVAYDGNGVHLDDGRQLHYWLPRPTARFGFGFSIRPKAAIDNASTWVFAELHGAARATDQQPKRARVRVVNGAPSILFENFTGGTSLIGHGNVGSDSGDLVEGYVLSTETHVHLWIRSYRAQDGEKIEVWTTDAPDDWEIHRISFGGSAGDIGTANSVFERIQIAQPAYHRPRPDDYFGRKITGDPLFVITFDDGYTTDYNAALYALDRGVAGTSFIVPTWADEGTGDATGNRRMTWAQVKDLHARGWDIQCHSYTHENLTTLTEQELRDEYENVNAAFNAQGLPLPRIHAYPFSGYNQLVRNVCLEYRDMARSVTLGLDSYAPNHGAIRSLLPDGTNGNDPYPSEAYKPENIYHFIDQLCLNGGIGVLCLHELENSTHEDFFEAVVDYAAKRIKVVTMFELLKILGPREMHGPYRQ